MVMGFSISGKGNMPLGIVLNSGKFSCAAYTAYTVLPELLVTRNGRCRYSEDCWALQRNLKSYKEKEVNTLTISFFARRVFW
jgi:hypothetical protein